jgi:hypothetical protein
MHVQIRLYGVEKSAQIHWIQAWQLRHKFDQLLRQNDKKLLSHIPFSHTLPQPHLSITFYDLLHKLHRSRVNQIDTLFPG